jgi:gluconate 2-dehydrogenase alpha chain
VTVQLPPVDVVIVGLGAGGGVAAHVLTEAGLEVAGIEAGPRLTTDDFLFDELRNDVHAHFSQPKAAHEIPTWRNDTDEVAGPPRWPMLMINAVGGTSVHYEAMSFRFQRWNFETRSQAIARYGASAIPAGSTVADWPVGYAELEPFYARVERAIGVSGTAAHVVGQPLNPAGNVFEEERSDPFPMPALRRTGWSELMAGGADALDWHPFPAPAGVNSEPYDGRPACTFCGFCQYNGCYQDSKGSTQLNVIKCAEATGRLRVETMARVTRIDVDDQGLASGVTFIRDGVEHFQPAKVVLVATFTYENTRLLLLSKSAAYPDGLSNNHGQVGKHYIAHVVPFAYGLFPDRRLNVFNGVGSQVTCIDDWNADNFDHSGLGFLSGGVMTAMHEVMPVAFARWPVPPGVPRWGSGWKQWVHANAQSVGAVFTQFDALPYESNFMDLDPTVVDRDGFPVIRVTHKLHPNEEQAYRFIMDKSHDWLRAAGATEVWEYPIKLVEGRHCYGGTRMGDDPDSSVVDRYGLSHEVPNLGLLGASTFPSAGGHNPTLTLQAHAWFAAQHIVDNWKSVAPV